MTEAHNERREREGAWPRTHPAPCRGSAPPSRTSPSTSRAGPSRPDADCSWCHQLRTRAHRYRPLRHRRRGALGEPRARHPCTGRASPLPVLAPGSRLPRGVAGHRAACRGHRAPSPAHRSGAPERPAQSPVRGVDTRPRSCRPARTGRLDAVLAQLPSLAGGVLGARIAAGIVPRTCRSCRTSWARRPRSPASRGAVAPRSWPSARSPGCCGAPPSSASSMRRSSNGCGPWAWTRAVSAWSQLVAHTGAFGAARADPGAPRLATGADRGPALRNMGLKQGLDVLVEAARRDPPPAWC